MNIQGSEVKTNLESQGGARGKGGEPVVFLSVCWLKLTQKNSRSCLSFTKATVIGTKQTVLSAVARSENRFDAK